MFVTKDKDGNILFADEDRQKLVNTLLFRPDLTEDMIEELTEDKNKENEQQVNNNIGEV